MTKEYEGTVYIGVVGPELIPAKAMVSIMNIARRDGDAIPQFHFATKGFEARQNHFNKFMESGHDFILMLDHDMIFPADTLERLRSHNLPYVSGLYMRRQYAPLGSIWFEPFSGEWPFVPFLDYPERGRLHEIGASGWGCILIHREVIESTREILKGEWDIIEDDMDVWPYDIKAVLEGKEQIRPLRMNNKPVGSDVRFPFYAQAAGWTLWGDPDVRPKHIADYPISPDDWGGQNLETDRELRAVTMKAVQKRRDEWLEATK